MVIHKPSLKTYSVYSALVLFKEDFHVCVAAPGVLFTAFSNIPRLRDQWPQCQVNIFFNAEAVFILKNISSSIWRFCLLVLSNIRMYVW